MGWPRDGDHGRPEGSRRLAFASPLLARHGAPHGRSFGSAPETLLGGIRERPVPDCAPEEGLPGIP